MNPTKGTDGVSILEVRTETPVTETDRTALRSLFADLGLDAEVSVHGNQRRDVSSWSLSIGIPLTYLLIKFGDGYVSKLGEMAAEASVESAATAGRRLHGWLQQLRLTRADREITLVVEDPETEVTVEIPATLPPEACEALWQVDPDRDGGEARYLTWTSDSGWTAPF
ncbi:hypothetical protein [Streptomyces sp. NPDC059919]|uniref:hypothetical protein n=1 Tax=Streptomyces sp. NPDC059919 TaxID=3347004 RepID=UPI00365B226D